MIWLRLDWLIVGIRSLTLADRQVGNAFHQRLRARENLDVLHIDLHRDELRRRVRRVRGINRITHAFICRSGAMSDGLLGRVNEAPVLEVGFYPNWGNWL